MSPRKQLLGALLSITCAGACNANSDRAAPAPSGSAEALVLPPPSEPKPVTSTPPATQTLTGTWEGRYDAKRARVELSEKVKDRVRAGDDGKTAVGPGTIHLTIEESHDVAGSAKGALGDATVIGQIDGDNIHAGISPDDPNAPVAMTGSLDGVLKDDRIHATIRTSNGDATIVREAKVVMQKQGPVSPGSVPRPSASSTSSTR